VKEVEFAVAGVFHNNGNMSFVDADTGIWIDDDVNDECAVRHPERRTSPGQLGQSGGVGGIMSIKARIAHVAAVAVQVLLGCLA